MDSISMAVRMQGTDHKEVRGDLGVMEVLIGMVVMWVVITFLQTNGEWYPENGCTLLHAN